MNVTQTVFNSNEASSGAGLDILMGFVVTILNSLFVFNKAKENGGGAIRVSGGILELSNCIWLTD